MRANRQELDALKGAIDPDTIRQQTPQHIDRLRELSSHVAAAFARLVVRSAPSPQSKIENQKSTMSSEVNTHARH